jgi:hypothetical protein
MTDVMFCIKDVEKEISELRYYEWTRLVLTAVHRSIIKMETRAEILFLNVGYC